MPLFSTPVLPVILDSLLLSGCWQLIMPEFQIADTLYCVLQESGRQRGKTQPTGPLMHAMQPATCIFIACPVFSRDSDERERKSLKLF